MTDALKDEFPDPETELAFLDFLATEWPNWRHHVGSDHWHIRRRSFLAGRTAPQALAATPAVGGEPVDITGWKLVPDNPTEEMWQAGRSADIHPGDSYSKVWRAMFNAAPNVDDCETTSSAAQPASPLRGREIDADEMDDFIRAILADNNPRSDEPFATVAKWIRRLRQQPRDELIEKCAKIADPWPGFQLLDDSPERDFAVVGCRTEIAASIRALKAASPPEQPEFQRTNPLDCRLSIAAPDEETKV